MLSRWKMKRKERRMLWYRGAKLALRVVTSSEIDARREAAMLLRVPGMLNIARDDYWVKGFVAMLRRQAKID